MHLSSECCKENCKIQNEEIRYSDLLTVVISHLSFTQKASCNFKFLPSTCLSTINFHTFNIIQMEDLWLLNTEANVYHVTQ